jgi:ADP-ribosylglycohydrolase
VGAAERQWELRKARSGQHGLETAARRAPRDRLSGDRTGGLRTAGRTSRVGGEKSDALTNGSIMRVGPIGLLSWRDP